MKIRNSMAAAVVAILLAACGTAPRLQALQPREGGVSPHVVAKSALVEQTNHMTEHLDSGKQIVYFQNAGGGGVAVGLLLGPIGVAANMAAIGSVTKADADVLRGKVDVDPRTLFLEAARDRHFPIVDAGKGNPKVSPYLYVAKTEGENLIVATALIVDQGEGASKWTGKYMYQLPGAYTLSSLSHPTEESNARIRQAAGEGYRALLQHMLAERAAGLAQERPIEFHSAVLSPRFDLGMTGALIGVENDLVWIRTVGGVYGLRKTDVAYKIQKPS